MIGQTISHYKILSKLGEGGMGVVYKAEDTKLKRTVALKFLSSQSLGTQDEKTRFVHEAQAAAALDHPNICTVYEIDESDGHTFIAMAHIDGQSLREKAAAGPLKLDEVLSLATDIARGLQEAHEKGIVHRDIKSANVIVTKKGQAKITDFGLAKLAGRTKVTKTGTSVGTAAYMSPEQARGDDVDQRTDIWSLGVVLYEMLTGRLPFRGDHEQAVTYQIVHEDPEPITAIRTGVPMELERIVSKCFEKKPSDRYQHVDELVVDLRKLKRASTPKPKKNLIRYVLPASVVLLAAILLVILKPFQSEITSEQRTGPVKLAVLPFENLGAPEDEYFADGITDEIISRLAVIKGLAVISRTSSMKYKKSDKGLREIGEELGVDYVLEGTIRWDKGSDAQRVRITPQLINVSDDFHLWAENYERDITQVFAVQADIATRIAETLNVTLLEGRRKELEEPPTDNLDAYQAYLRGLSYEWIGGAADDAQRSQEMFERAIGLDPQFALGYAELSKVHSGFYHLGLDRSEERLSMARNAVDRALELQSELPQAHVALGYYYYWGRREYDHALEEFAIAEKSLPDNPEILSLVGYIKRRQGDFETGLEKLRRALELDPQVSGRAYEVAITYRFLRQYEDAARHFERAISLRPDLVRAYLVRAKVSLLWRGDLETARETLERMPKRDVDLVADAWLQQWLFEKNYEAILDFAASTSRPILNLQRWVIPLALMAGFAYRLQGESEHAQLAFASAVEVLEKVLEERPHDHRLHAALGLAYAGLERKAEAIREGKRAVELFPVSKDALDGPYQVRNLAMIYAMVGENEASLDEIEHILSIPGYFSVQLLRLDPRWDPLREHPRFQALLEKYSGGDS